MIIQGRWAFSWPVPTLTCRAAFSFYFTQLSARVKKEAKFSLYNYICTYLLRANGNVKTQDAIRARAKHGTNSQNVAQHPEAVTSTIQNNRVLQPLAILAYFIYSSHALTNPALSLSLSLFGSVFDNPLVPSFAFHHFSLPLSISNSTGLLAQKPSPAKKGKKQNMTGRRIEE